MATAEVRTSQDERGPPGDAVYDGFISYSHAADDLLAPRLQAGLQRFAKPWWKRRALRIFRDESSLSANPHLWSSITTALDQSGWFVLLLSPDAAESEWVNQEVEYWLEHKESDRIIPVVTDGEFTWSETDIDLESTAVPPALYGAFADEPRWVDLRFARSEEQLDLNNPRFSAAVADIASAIRGVPKDELESEEVRQHRRTVRTAWAASIVVLLLAVLAGAAALFALDQRNDAQAATGAEAEQRQLAESNAAEADRQRDEAEAAAARETEARREAERSALLASSNELALRAEKEIPVDAERAMLLAIEAIGLAREAGIEPVESTQALRNALNRSRVVHRLPGGSFVAMSDDGLRLATASDDGVAVWDAKTWELVATFDEVGGVATAAAFSSSGDRLAVVYMQSDQDSIVAPVVVYDIAGSTELPLEGDPLPQEGGVDFAGRDLIVAHFYVASEDRWGVGVFSAVTGELLLQLEDGLFAVDPSGGRVAIISADERLRVHNISSGEVLVDVEGSESNLSVQFSPDGTRLVEISPTLSRLMIRDAATGEVLLSEQINRLCCGQWLDDFRVVAGGEGSTRVIDSETGDILFELAGHTSPVFGLDAVPGTDRLATAGWNDGTTLIWDVTPAGLTELPVWDTGLSDLRFVFQGPDGSLVLRTDSGSGSSLWSLTERNAAPELIVDGADWFVLNTDGTLLSIVRTDDTSAVFSVPDGEIVYMAPPGLAIRGVNNDGSLVLLVDPLADEAFPIVVETATGREVDRVSARGDEVYQFSPDSSLVFTYCCTGESVYLLPGGEPSGFAVGFKTAISDSGAMLAYPPNFEGDMWLLDTGQLNTTRDLESSRVAEISAHSDLIFQDFSNDETMLLTTTFDEPIRIWDITGVLDGGEPTLIAEIDAAPRSGAPAAYFRSGDNHIVSISTGGLLREFTIDTDELIAIAKARLTRALTVDECATFGIDPCPTLEEVKAGG